MKKSTFRVFLLVNAVITSIYGMCIGLLCTSLPILGVLLAAVAILHVLLLGCICHIITEEDVKSRFK